MDGRLFGSVTNVDIVEALQKQDLAVEKAMIRMPAGRRCAGPATPTRWWWRPITTSWPISLCPWSAIRPKADSPHRNTRKGPRRYPARPFAFSECREKLSSAVNA